jgi:hypothetical protein
MCESDRVKPDGMLRRDMRYRRSVHHGRLVRLRKLRAEVEIRGEVTIPTAIAALVDRPRDGSTELKDWRDRWQRQPYRLRFSAARPAIKTLSTRSPPAWRLGHLQSPPDRVQTGWGRILSETTEVWKRDVIQLHEAASIAAKNLFNVGQQR